MKASDSIHTDDLLLNQQIEQARKQQHTAEMDSFHNYGVLDGIKRFLGMSNRADLEAEAAKARAEGLEDKAADFEMQLALLDYMNKYNSPAEKAKRRKEAGYNANLEGDAADSADVMPAPGPAPTSALDPSAMLEQDSQILNSFGGAAATLGQAFSVYTSLQHLQIMKDTMPAQIDLMTAQAEALRSQVPVNKSHETVNEKQAGLIESQTEAQKIANTENAPKAKVAAKVYKSIDDVMSPEELYETTSGYWDLIKEGIEPQRAMLQMQYDSAMAEVTRLKNTDVAGEARLLSEANKAQSIATVAESGFSADYYNSANGDAIAQSEYFVALQNANKARYELAIFNRQVEQAERFNAMRSNSNNPWWKRLYGGLRLDDMVINGQFFPTPIQPNGAINPLSILNKAK